MESLLEIRWHGRGGQGTVTAAKILAEVALEEGKHIQAFPEYGPERMGAPLRAYNRLSTTPLTIHCGVTNPDCVVVVDDTLLGAVDLTEGAKPGTIYIFNSAKEPGKVAARLGVDPGKVFCVDATKISIETLGRPMPNTPMLGALVKTTGMVTLENMLAILEQQFGKKFRAEVVSANLEAVNRAYREVKGNG
jgi:pyruvate ferredoxin oxidoreductase gamma subunit